MTTGSSLIRGSTALFGVKTTMQFGKLTATALISQQQSESKTVNARVRGHRPRRSKSGQTLMTKTGTFSYHFLGQLR